MPSPFDKPDKKDKQEKAEKPGKPEVSKDKPFSLPSIPLEFMPPSAKHPNRLVAVTGASGETLYLAFSTEAGWVTLPFGDYLPVNETPIDPPDIPVVTPPED